MRRILLLGGIGEARRLAHRLARDNKLTYSLAGRAGVPQLPCPVRVGGFGGVAGLSAFLKEGRFDLLIDATHPYAARISLHAHQAAEQTALPLWAYRRPAWQPEPGDDWRIAKDWSDIKTAIEGFHRPFFTLGLEPLQHAQSIPAGQHWLVRCLTERPATSNLTVLGALGPFALEEELKLMDTHQVDVLITKNSGGQATAAKLAAARRLGIPVVMLERPPLPPADREFEDIETLIDSLTLDPSPFTT